MTNKTYPTMPQQDFEHMLEVYGADRTRWPLAARAGAAARLACDRQARQKLAEAEALDAVLLQTPEPSESDVAALTERIMAATRQSPRLGVDQREIRFAAVPEVKARVSTNTAQSGLWRGVALLAASLMIGVFIGQSQFGAQALPVFEAFAGVVRPATAERLAMADTRFEQVDED